MTTGVDRFKSENMEKSFKTILITSAGLIIFIPVALALLVRYAEETASSGGYVIPGVKYDKTGENKNREFDGSDGPYIIDSQMIYVDQNLQIVSTPLTNTDSVFVAVNNESRDQFYVKLRSKHTAPDWNYAMPDKLIAISDIEGNFNGFAAFLLSNGVIDEHFNWTYGDGHLVLVGDFVDRGDYVTQTLWLIYHLEGQAEAQGGKVHFILGNHEIMNIQGDFSYAKAKNRRFAKDFGKNEDFRVNNRIIFSNRSELGKWLRSKNIAEKVGPYLFVHAGISPDVLQFNLPLSRMNELVRKHIDGEIDKPKVAFLMGSNGPHWYRGWVKGSDRYPEAQEPALDRILKQYDAEKMVVGHSIVEDVSTFYNGKIICIDLKHRDVKHSGATKGFLVENGAEYKVDDLGRKIAM